MIDNRFNALAHWDNPEAVRYSVELEIISVDIDIEGNGETFPTIEIWQWFYSYSIFDFGQHFDLSLGLSNVCLVIC